MMTYGRIKAAERARQLLEQPRNLALTGPLVSIIINASLALAGVAGLFMAAQGLKAGPTVVLAAMVWASAHSVIVRMRNGTDVQLPDERERTNATNAAVVGSNLTVMLLGSWFLLLGVFADHGMWYPDRSEEWQAAGLFILGLNIQITNIAKAWMIPSYAAELLDDD
jgi:hypothetical protein